MTANTTPGTADPTPETPLDTGATKLISLRRGYDRLAEPLLTMLDAYFPYAGFLASGVADQLFYLLVIAPTLATLLVVSGVLTGVSQFVTSVEATAALFGEYAMMASSQPLLVAAGLATAYAVTVRVAPPTEAQTTRVAQSVTKWQMLPAALKAGAVGFVGLGVAYSGLGSVLPAPYGSLSAGALAAVVGSGFVASRLRRVIREDQRHAGYTDRHAGRLNEFEQVESAVSRAALVFAGTVVVLGGVTSTTALLVGGATLLPFFVAFRYYTWRSLTQNDVSTPAEEGDDVSPTREFYASAKEDDDVMNVQFHAEVQFDKESRHWRATLPKFGNDAQRIHDLLTLHYEDEADETLMKDIDAFALEADRLKIEREIEEEQTNREEGSQSLNLEVEQADSQ